MVPPDTLFHNGVIRVFQFSFERKSTEKVWWSGLDTAEYLEFWVEQKSRVKIIKRKINQVKYLTANFVNTKVKKCHVTTHEKSIYLMLKIPCDLCGYKATEQGSLIKHKQSKHIGIKYSCSKCEKQFTGKGTVNSQMKSKHLNQKYPCTDCEKQHK